MDAFLPLGKLFRPDAAWFLRQREILPESMERVFRALTDPAELSQWWCERSEVDLRVGGYLAFHGRYVYGNDPLLPPQAFQILELEPSRIEFRWPLRGLATRVLVEISEILDGTEVVVTQTAEQVPPWSPPEGSHHWWSVALPGLRSYLERGQPDLRLDFPVLRAADELRYRVEVSTFPWMIWRKLTDPAELRRWLAPQARVELAPGGAFDLGPGPGPRQILEMDEERLLVLDWHEAGGPVSRVSFGIAEGDEGTTLTLTDHGPRPAGEDDDARDRRIFRWAGAILHLKQLSERGATPREYQEG